MTALPLQNLEIRRFLQGRNGERIMLVLNLLLVIWIASALAKLTWGLIDSPQAPELADIGSGAAPAAAPDRDRELIRQLPGLHLMGEADRAETPAAVAAPINAPETRLKLTLRGSLATETHEEALAIIADPRGEELHYSIGDKLPGNAELKEIHPDRVILMRNGRYETLRLPETSKKGSNTRRSSPGPGPATSSRLRNLQQQARTTPGSLYQLIRVAPMQADGQAGNGKLRGYKVSPGRDKTLFNELGLQDGDVVVQVNDVRLDTVENGMAALKSVQSGDSVSLIIERDGAEQEMAFSLPAQ